jgi:DNA-binding transcriptional LysR family regulator
MDRLEAMALLLDVVDTGSLSAASRKRRIPLATISRKISDLEAHLKTRLLSRSGGRRMTLTDTGRSYVAVCRQILEDVSEAERTASGQYSLPKGNLVITAPVVFGRLHVLPVVIDFLKTYPEIDVRLVLADHVVNLFDARIDVALRIGTLSDSSLIAVRLGAVRQIVCGSPTYLAAHGAPKDPGELSAHHCVTFENRMSPQAWSFRSGKTDKSYPIHSRLVVNTAEAAIAAAVAGLGLTRLLSYQTADARRAGTLSVVLAEFEPEPSPVNLVHLGGAFMPTKTRTFLDYAAARLKTAIREKAN